MAKAPGKVITARVPVAEAPGKVITIDAYRNAGGFITLPVYIYIYIYMYIDIYIYICIYERKREREREREHIYASNYSIYSTYVYIYIYMYIYIYIYTAYPGPCEPPLARSRRHLAWGSVPLVSGFGIWRFGLGLKGLGLRVY